jgi:hypothetical protein
MSTSYGATPPENDPAARGAGESRPPVGRDGEPVARDRESVVAREKEEYGGIKIGSAFFGWLTATGTATILTGLLAATGAALGLGVVLESGASARVGSFDGKTIAWIGAGALLLVVLLAYYCGGYVAGRMARFSGVAQGLAVWVWALVITILVALVGVAFGSRFDFLGEAGVLPRVPVSEGVLAIAGIIAAVVVAVASLGGAIFGGVIGVRYHRRVDRVGLDG